MTVTVQGTKKSGRRRLGRILGEVAIVFVGITASFWVDDWREERQDTATFHRILGEIYYDLRIDDSLLTGSAANNNRALLLASDLVLRDKPLPDGADLFRQLEIVFTDWRAQSTQGGHTRLINTPLAIPVNDVQLTLDSTFALYSYAQEDVDTQIARIRELANQHWWSRGVIACTNPLQGTELMAATIEALDLLNQVRPADEAVRNGDDCITTGSNASAAFAAMQDDSFRMALRQVIAIRRTVASNLVWQRAINARLRGTLEGYLPDISLPIDTLGLVGSATPADWEVSKFIPMRRTAPNEWVLDVQLDDGEVKFAANREWTMNWGAPQPWVGTDVGMSFAPGQVAIEHVFPRGRSQFNGLNIPVKAGRYRVTFNSRTGEYIFDKRT